MLARMSMHAHASYTETQIWTHTHKHRSDPNASFKHVSFKKNKIDFKENISVTAIWYKPFLPNLLKEPFKNKLKGVKYKLGPKCNHRCQTTACILQTSPITARIVLISNNISQER